VLVSLAGVIGGIAIAEQQIVSDASLSIPQSLATFDFLPCEQTANRADANQH
jgi:hypothetical protein